ncbi:hypothetical protein DY000_02038319 [Brassica cretica]|uniref:Uncharacterized protein n=1 Tax=Brassica cretica TaxID=69181 RepID=A0ABQ7B724_BRACR|nr:hypothetical protein DY000_02038319 [Brassica cretica]
MGKTTQRQTGKHCQQRYKAIEYMEEWRGIKEEEIAEVKRSISNNRNIKWKPPPQQCIKCNTYGAWSKDRQRSGVSWVNRDHMGRLPWAGAKSFQRLGSTNIYIYRNGGSSTQLGSSNDAKSRVQAGNLRN